MRSPILPIVLLAMLGIASVAPAASADGAGLPPTRVRDLHYGDVLFHFYQDQYVEAATRLTAYTQWERLPNHRADAQLLLGGMYLSLGMHDEAGALFERLLTADVPAGVRDRAWLFLGKIWYARGYLDRAEQALRAVRDALPEDLRAERLHLLVNVLMQTERFDEAIRLLDGWKGPADWALYSRFNLGVALVRSGQLDVAEHLLTAVGTLDTREPELLALKDRANVALGFARLQAGQPREARVALERVRLNGPYSNEALLGTGWADASSGAFRRALVPWMELHGRNLLDMAVQESYLAVPYAFGQLKASTQAAEHYELALRAYDEESRRIDEAIQRVRSGDLLSRLVAEEDGRRADWFQQLETVPDAIESRYLYSVLAGHEFQEGLKNYRDLTRLGGMLARWSESMEAFAHSIDARRLAHAGRLARADAQLGRDSFVRAGSDRDRLAAQLSEIEAQRDLAALGSAEEQSQWARITRLEAALQRMPDDPDTRQMKERLRLAKGVLQYRLERVFEARLRREGEALTSLEALLKEAESRRERLAIAREAIPARNEEFARRVAALDLRLKSSQERVHAAARKQADHLQQLAVSALESRKSRLADYHLQARFALAALYDQAFEAQVRPVRADTEAETPSSPVTPPAAPDAPDPLEETAPRRPEEPRL